MKNGYPKSIVDRYTGRDSTREKPYGPPLCPVYMKLPYVGTNSDRFERSINEAARMAHYCVKVHVVFTTTPAFRVRKDRLPIPQMSNIIYQFECRQCGSRYVSRSQQHLSSRIRQHVPLHLLPDEARAQRPRRGRPPKKQHQAEKSTPQQKRTGLRSQVAISKPTSITSDAANKLHSNYDSAVANHSAGNEHCRLQYSDGDFSVLARARSKLHLCVLEALYIRHLSPDLCAQNFVLALSLFSPNSSP